MATLALRGFGKDAAKKFVDAKCIQEGQDKRRLIIEELWDEEDFDACVFDEDTMMTHILDCYAALCSFQQYRGSKKQSKKLDAKTQQAKNKVFKTAMSLMSEGMTNDDAKIPDDTSALSNFLTKFPNDAKKTDGRGWMPLHWAVLAVGTPVGDFYGLVEEDVKLLYAADLQSLQRFYDAEDDEWTEEDQYRYTPAHFLCMQPNTPHTMSLLRYFSTCNPQALINSEALYSDFSLLHAICQFGQPTEELLQHLLQLDSTQVTKTCGQHNYTPLQHLCGNDCCNERLMTCLLQFDSSAAVVAGAIRVSHHSTADPANLLERVDMLLKVNPEAAQHRFDSSQENLLHCLGGYSDSRDNSSALCIDIMKRILALYPDAVKEVNNDGELPLHTAAKYNTIEVMGFLLGLYPESVAIVTVGTLRNSLHLLFHGFFVTNREQKVRYLCSRYPDYIRQRDKDGETPLHTALHHLYSKDVSLLKILFEFGGQELIKLPTVHPTATNDSCNGWLPLHYFIRYFWLPWREHDLHCFISKEADFFRSMLLWYPEAAGIEAGNGSYKMTPYQLAVERDLNPYYLRLLLRAAPDLNPSELRRLNWAERRMAMFMAFRAVTTDVTPLMLARLRFENKDLVKHVVSFL